MSDMLEKMSSGDTISEINEIIAEAGFALDIDSALEDEFTEQDLIDLYKQTIRALKLLLLSENLSPEKLDQAMYLAQNLK